MLKLYSQPTCGMCKALHIKLDRLGIPYEEIQDLKIMKAKGIQSVPVIELDDGKLLRGADAFSYVNKKEETY